jgi:hypothetical protein
LNGVYQWDPTIPASARVLFAWRLFAVRRTSLLVFALALFVGGCAVSATAGRAPVSDDVRASILALVTDGLERLRLGDPRGITSRCAEDVTYYSVEFDSLLVGRQALEDMYGPPTGRTYYDHFDLINPMVRVYGEMAIVTFDFASYGDADESQLRTRWRSTQVLRLTGGDWQIVHIHWTLLESNL